MKWRESYATIGQFDVIDIVEFDDPKQVEKAAMIVRALGRSSTETLVLLPGRNSLLNYGKPGY